MHSVRFKVHSQLNRLRVASLRLLRPHQPRQLVPLMQHGNLLHRPLRVAYFSIAITKEPLSRARNTTGADGAASRQAKVGDKSHRGAVFRALSHFESSVRGFDATSHNTLNPEWGYSTTTSHPVPIYGSRLSTSRVILDPRFIYGASSPEAPLGSGRLLDTHLTQRG